MMSGADGLIKLEKIPVYICEGHSAVLKFINRQIDKKVLPKEGNVIVKFDALPDEVVPKKMLYKTDLEPLGMKKSLFGDIGMHEWIKKMAVNGNLEHLIWIKPPWSEVAKDGSDCNEIEKSNNEITKIAVDIQTFGKELFQNENDDYEKIGELSQKYLNGKKWILDIDLTFFSTINPFIGLYQKAQAYPLIEDLFSYKLPENYTPEELKKCQEYRENQIKELEQIFKYLDENRQMPKSENPTELYKKVQELKEKIEQHFEDDLIDWKHIYDAGCVINKYQLPVNQNDREKVLEFLNGTFSKLLGTFLDPPTIITVARSCEYDCFVPMKDCNFIEKNLVKVLEEKFKIDEPEMPYLDQ